MLLATLFFAIKVTAGCDPAHFIARAYQDLLGRPIDTSATAYWLGVMKKGATRTQVATQLMRSAEYANARVQAMYNTYFHRPADSSMVAIFSGMLQHGSTDDNVASTILASQEYFARRGHGTNPGFIAALFQDVLGRAADPQGANFFVQQLEAGGTRLAITRQMVTSAEARQRWLGAVYAKYLRHGAPRSAVSGGQDQVIASIVGSEEYCRQ